MVMDCLADYLFPAGERQVVEWMNAGVSMGGHITWRLIWEGGQNLSWADIRSPCPHRCAPHYCAL